MPILRSEEKVETDVARDVGYYYYWIWKEYILTKLENAPPLFVGTKMQI